MTNALAVVCQAEIMERAAGTDEGHGAREEQRRELPPKEEEAQILQDRRHRESTTPIRVLR